MNSTDLFEKYKGNLNGLNIERDNIAFFYEYEFGHQMYPVLIVHTKPFFQLMTKYFGKMTYIRKILTRGFTVHGLIILKVGTVLGKDRLILHEIGHILGYDHTLKPDLMNPTWIFRWSDKLNRK